MKLTTYRKDNLPGAGRWGRSKQFKHCCYCERQIPIVDVTREHIIPKSKGGRIIRPCCLACNQEKGNRLPIDWVIYLYGFDMSVKKNKVKLKNAINYLVALYPGEYDFIFKN